MKKLKLWLITLVMILALTLTGCDFLGPFFGFGEEGLEPQNLPTADESDMIINNMRLGDPMWNYDERLTAEENFAIRRDSYVLSYNNIDHIPNWVSWHIEPSHLGGEERPGGSFKQDDLLPDDWERVKHDDFTNSGFDRGHMCPNADRNGNETMQKDTFYTTNIIPQSHANNGGPWKDLEGHIQKLCEEGHEAYVVAGTWGEGGQGKLKDGTLVKKNVLEAGPDKYGHEMTIKVPAYTWKVAVVIPNGKNDIERINAKKGVETFAVLMPNVTKGIESNHFEDYVVSIDFIEEITGYDFFANVINSTEDRFEKENSGSVTETKFRKSNGF